MIIYEDKKNVFKIFHYKIRLTLWINKMKQKLNLKSKFNFKNKNFTMVRH
jgi:hypothetical protein